MTRSAGVVLVALLSAHAAQAVPTLSVSDSYTNNVWTGPATCLAGTGSPPSPPCAPAITAVAGPPSGFKLQRANTAPGAQGSSMAHAFDNGVLRAGTEGGGQKLIRATARFVEAYVYGGPSTPYIVPFTVTPFRLGANSSGVGDTQAARMRINIRVTTLSGTSTVADLQYTAYANSVTAFAAVPAPVPVAGVTLPPGFVSIASVVVPNSVAVIGGPGGSMAVDLGTFTAGQVFKLDYRMSCLSYGSGSGSAYCRVGDPFSIPSGSGFDLGGLSVGASAVPEPAAWGMLLIGFGAIGALARRRSARETGRRTLA